MPLKSVKSEFMSWALTTLDAIKYSDRLTVGIEHEFFLLDIDGLPARHEQSQHFLLEISKSPGWYVRDSTNDVSGEMISKVSQEDGNGKYTVIKYDHHPHLMEIAFSWSDSLFVIEQNVKKTFAMIERIARELQLIVSTQSNLNIPASHDRVTSPLKEFRNLRHYREKLLSVRNSSSDMEHANYAAVIAATQTHVGGTRWWKERSFMASIYSYEPKILSMSSRGGHSQRWNGYSKVFEGYPLIGFPNVANWTLDTWAEALLDSPLAGSEEDEWSGKSARALGTIPLVDRERKFESFIACVRDLQIVRPKFFGTLEFRADPAQDSPENILAMAALRLGLCSYIKMSEEIKELDFSCSRLEWWRKVNASDVNQLYCNDAKVTVAHASLGLIARNLGEQKFLLPLIDRLNSRSAA